MSFDFYLNLPSEEDLFSVRKQEMMLDEPLQLLPADNTCRLSIFCMDHLTEMEKIMSYLDRLQLPEVLVPQTEESEGDEISGRGVMKKTQIQSSLPLKCQKKIKKVQNSPFHNYQKHLNNALKKLVIVPRFEEHDEEYKKAARDIWSAYISGDIKTKKILHFVFNERNQHQIKEQELRSYGLFQVYQQYGNEVIAQAKTYLSKLAIDQIEEGSVESYMKTRKMRKTQGFKDYVLSFKNQLLSGYIKRRVHLQINQY